MPSRNPQLVPSLSLLLAFDAVVRHGSVTAAASELHLTQSTVSRLVQALEAQLGRALFVRTKRRLVPTAAARAYQRDVGRALDLIERGSLALIANPDGGTLSLAVPPTFGTRWLAPRLHELLDGRPGISLNIATRTRRFDFDIEPFDAVIFHGQPDWPGVEHAKLFDERLTACASRSFVAKHRIKRPRDLFPLPRLELETRLGAWDAWFRGQGEPATTPRSGGMLLDQFSLMIQAAISGLGVALLPEYLAALEIEEGRLVAIGKRGVPSDSAYWLAWPPSRSELEPLRALRAWLAV